MNYNSNIVVAVNMKSLQEFNMSHSETVGGTMLDYSDMRPNSKFEVHRQTDVKKRQVVSNADLTAYWTGTGRG